MIKNRRSLILFLSLLGLVKCGLQADRNRLLVQTENQVVAQTDSIDGRPPINVYIHIGPPKTGCTHLQHFIMTNLDTLKKYSYCYPANPPLNNKALSRLAFDLRGDRNLSTHEELIQQCLSNNNNILMSAENLAALPEEKLFTLKSLFPTEFQGRKIQIFILMAYREWLSRIYSHYAQESKVSFYRAGPVSEFIYEGYGHVEGNLDFDLPAMVSRYDKVFGKDQVILVDYHGILASKKDIVHVYLCEIMKVFCSVTSKLNQKTTYENVRPLAHILHLISIVRDYVHFQGYRWNHQGNIGRVSRLLLANYTESNLKLPLRVSRLTLLHPYSTRLDREFRALYDSRMLFANASASELAMKGLEAFEVNEKVFYANDTWIEWLKHEFEVLRSKNWIVKKKGDPRDKIGKIVAEGL